MMDIRTLINLIAFCVPYVAACLVSAKMNFRKEHRYKQVFLPLIAVIYCIVAMIYLNRISDFVLDKIYWAADHIFLLSFLRRFNWARMAIFAVNTALVTGFIAVKGTTFPMLMGLALVPKLTDYAASRFYFKPDKEEEDGVKGARYLKSRYGDARRIAGVMYYAMVGLFAVLLIATYYMDSAELLSAPFYPAFGTIVLGEIVAFLSGKTYEEKEEEESGGKPAEDDPEPDYDSLQDEYRKIFPARLAQSSFEKVTEHIAETADRMLDKCREEYAQTQNQEAGLMDAYYRDREKDGFIPDEGYLRQTRNLLDGRTVLFFTQFYSDTTDYVFLPAVRQLMRGKKILAVLGHSSSADSVRQWLVDGISSVTGFRSIWKTDTDPAAGDAASIMVLESKDLYNQDILTSRAGFFSNTSMVFIFGANELLGTMQIGLSCLVSYLRRGGNKPQYVIYDRNCDGLVDSLSHVLRTSIEQVNAVSVGTAKKNMMFWKADGKPLHHKLGLTNARYLGMGTELAVVALRRSVSRVVWASGRKFPVVDMNWIAFQYYRHLCAAAGLDVSQNSLAERLSFTSAPGSLERTVNSMVIVEDEFNNAFEAARQFSTRGTRQSFVHVLSQAYWLREYMMDNMSIFQNDSKAIPTITADYQRGTGNTVFRLILRLIEGEVEESELCELYGIEGEDSPQIYRNLRDQILRHFFGVEQTDGEQDRDAAQAAAQVDASLSCVVRSESDTASRRMVQKRYYSIKRKSSVEAQFWDKLEIVYYKAEDETDRSHYLESSMYGHVCQKYLPGMLITLQGKYYEVVSASRAGGVIVRRAADHISGRQYYRVLKSFTLTEKQGGHPEVERYTCGKITIERRTASVTVSTSGYLSMPQYNDMKNARRTELNQVDERTYSHKEYLRIRLPDTSEEVRTTLAVLLNELFVTVFPDHYPYIAACAVVKDKGATEGYMPVLEGTVEDDSIYIIEDSLISLGYLINAERYFVRFMEIICDALNWHEEKMNEDDGPEEEEEPPEDDSEEEKPEKGFGAFLRRLFRRLFGRGREAGGENGGENVDEKPESPVSMDRLPDRAAAERAAAERPAAGRVQAEGSPEDDVDGKDSGSMRVSGGDLPEDEDAELPYAESFYLLYGFESVPQILDPDSTRNYLNEQGFGSSSLRQARDANRRRKLKWYNYYFEPGIHYCDFCGAPMEDRFDVLDDGRERCLNCSQTAITKVSELKKLYKRTRKQMENVFGIKLKEHIKIRMCDAHEIAAGFGDTFKPTSGVDGRVLGYASAGGRTHDVFIENGSPAVETERVLVHEMTHVWQYNNMMKALFGGTKDQEAVEGMAVWAEVQYMTSIGLHERARDYRRNRERENNEYGNGLRKYLEKYPIRNKAAVHAETPFTCRGNPLL